MRQRRENKKLSRLEMRGRLQTNGRYARSRILPAVRHLFDLLENELVEPPRGDLGLTNSCRERGERDGEAAAGDEIHSSHPSQVKGERHRGNRLVWHWRGSVVRKVVLRFTKMNGAGNDFVLLDNRAGNLQLAAAEIVHICDRHRGVGADGVLVLERAANGADFRMRYYNADGGEAEMCGNGARCFARFASRVAGPMKSFRLKRRPA